MLYVIRVLNYDGVIFSFCRATVLAIRTVTSSYFYCIDKLVTQFSFLNVMCGFLCGVVGTSLCRLSRGFREWN
jgi:hypothetical protein